MGVYIVSSYDSTLSCIRINGSESWDKYRLLQDHSRLSSLSIWGLEHQFLAHHICRCHTYVPSRLTSSHGFNFDFDANWKKHSQNYNETAIQLSLNFRELDQTKKNGKTKWKKTQIPFHHNNNNEYEKNMYGKFKCVSFGSCEMDAKIELKFPKPITIAAITIFIFPIHINSNGIINRGE